MKQTLLSKMETIEIAKEITLQDVLLDSLHKVGLGADMLDLAARHVIFSVDGTMVSFRDKVSGKLDIQKILATVVKAGQKVKLLPAHRAG